MLKKWYFGGQKLVYHCPQGPQIDRIGIGISEISSHVFGKQS